MPARLKQTARADATAAASKMIRKLKTVKSKKAKVVTKAPPSKKSDVDADGARKKRKWKPGTVALRRIRSAQSAVGDKDKAFAKQP